MCIIPMVAHSQDFEFLYDGTFKTADGADFVVVPFDGKSQTELFDMVKNNVTAIFASPKDVISTSGTDMISVSGFQKEVFVCKVMGMAIVIDAHYTIKIAFKDGRVRVSAPVITSFSERGYMHENTEKYLRDMWFFKKDHSPKYKEKIDNIGETFSTLAKSLLYYQAKTEDDW